MGALEILFIIIIIIIINCSVSNVGSYKRMAQYNLSCVLQTYCRLNASKMVRNFRDLWHHITSYGSGWRKGVIKHCLGFEFGAGGH